MDNQNNDTEVIEDMYLFREGLSQITQAMETLLAAKRASYGPGNLLAFGLFGVLVRASDKFERLKHMYEKQIRVTEVGENEHDAWRDICGYSLLALMFIKYGPRMLPTQSKRVEQLDATIVATKVASDDIKQLADFAMQVMQDFPTAATPEMVEMSERIYQYNLSQAEIVGKE